VPLREEEGFLRLQFLSRGVAAGLLLLAAPEVRAVVTIEHAAVGCMVAERFPRFEARFDPAADVSRARLHFRPAGGPHWYSVPMKAEGPVFAGVLPKPKRTLQKLEYYIEVTDKSFGSARTAEYDPDVASGLGACQDKPVAGALGSASVLIEGPAGAPLVPVGFDPEGVVAVSSSTAASTGGGGLGKTALILGGVAAAGAGVAVAAGGSSSSGETSGGGSAGGGGGPAPCQPAPITSTLTNPSTTLACGQPLTAGVVVTNGSCSALGVQSIQLTQNAVAGPFCSAVLAQFSYPPAVSTVGAGQTTNVLNFQSATFCCPGGPCPGTTVCTYQETFAVQTSAGPVPSGATTVQVSFNPSCPVCP
jgi:uncharacterized membrane protein YgcG